MDERHGIRVGVRPTRSTIGWSSNPLLVPGCGEGGAVSQQHNDRYAPHFVLRRIHPQGMERLAYTKKSRTDKKKRWR